VDLADREDPRRGARIPLPFRNDRAASDGLASVDRPVLGGDGHGDRHRDHDRYRDLLHV
jgi:hypothetical protein